MKIQIPENKELSDLILIKMEKPNKEKYGWYTQCGFDDEPTGWLIEGGEEAYEEAMKRWQFMQDNGLGEEDMINDITLPNEH